MFTTSMECRNTVHCFCYRAHKVDHRHAKTRFICQFTYAFTQFKLSCRGSCPPFHSSIDTRQPHQMQWQWVLNVVHYHPIHHRVYSSPLLSVKWNKSQNLLPSLVSLMREPPLKSISQWLKLLMVWEVICTLGIIVQRLCWHSWSRLPYQTRSNARPVETWLHSTFQKV